MKLKITRERYGVTLADSLCGLFITALALGLYLNANQIMHQQMTISNQKVIHERHLYERTFAKVK